MPGTSAQRAALIDLTQALRWGKAKSSPIYTDSHYAYTVQHVHSIVYRAKGLLTTGEKDVQNHWPD